MSDAFERALALILPHQARMEGMGDAPTDADRLSAIDAIAADLPAFNAIMDELGGEQVELRYPDHVAFRHICVLMDMGYALKPFDGKTRR